MCHVTSMIINGAKDVFIYLYLTKYNLKNDVLNVSLLMVFRCFLTAFVELSVFVDINRNVSLFLS